MGAGNPLVSVIVLNWNGKKFLKDCFSSLQKQTYDNYEAIFVDNNSSDDSVKFMKKNFPEVRIIVNKENLGFAEGNNVAIRTCKGKYVILLNPDTNVDKNWIKELIKVAESDEKIGMCASREMDFENVDIVSSAGVIMTRDISPFNRGFDKKDINQYNNVEEVFSAHGSSMLLKRSMLDEIDLLDPDFFMSNEETDLAWRARLRGWKCVYVPDAVVYHVGSGIARDYANLVVYYLERNRIYMIIKNMGLSSILLYLPYLLIYELFAIVYSILGFNFIRLRVRLDVLINLRKMLRKRRQIQKTRVISESEIRNAMVKPNYLKQIDYIFKNIIRKVKKILGLGGSS